MIIDNNKIYNSYISRIQNKQIQAQRNCIIAGVVLNSAAILVLLGVLYTQSHSANSYTQIVRVFGRSTFIGRKIICINALIALVYLPTLVIAGGKLLSSLFRLRKYSKTLKANRDRSIEENRLRLGNVFQKKLIKQQNLLEILTKVASGNGSLKDLKEGNKIIRTAINNNVDSSVQFPCGVGIFSPSVVVAALFGFCFFQLLSLPVSYGKEALTQAFMVITGFITVTTIWSTAYGYKNILSAEKKHHKFYMLDKEKNKTKSLKSFNLQLSCTKLNLTI